MSPDDCHQNGNQGQTAVPENPGVADFVRQPSSNEGSEYADNGEGGQGRGTGGGSGSQLPDTEKGQEAGKTAENHGAEHDYGGKPPEGGPVIGQGAPFTGGLLLLDENFLGGFFQLGDDEEKASAQDEAKKTKKFQAGQSPEGDKENRQQGANAEARIAPYRKDADTGTGVGGRQNIYQPDGFGMEGGGADTHGGDGGKEQTVVAKLSQQGKGREGHHYAAANEKALFRPVGNVAKDGLDKAG